MRYERLKSNLMNCIYNVEFGHKYTTVIGKNTSGKSKVGSLIHIAFYGTGHDSDVHHSWKFSEDGLGDGYVELIFRDEYDIRYKIRRNFGSKKEVKLCVERKGKFESISPEFDKKTISKKEEYIKIFLEENFGVTPVLMNVVMSNERNQLGMISYDPMLQKYVWTGFEWKSKIIKDNINKCIRGCDTEIYGEKGINIDLSSLDLKKGKILEDWQKNEIFKKDELIDKNILDEKYKSIVRNISSVDLKIGNYKSIEGELDKLRSLEDIDIVKKMINICENIIIDEKDEVANLCKESKNYLNTLEKVINEGKESGIKERIKGLEGEIKKLDLSKNLKDRKNAPLKVECYIYSPESDKEALFVQLPDEESNKYSYDDIDHGHIAIKWSLEKEESTTNKKTELEKLLVDFEYEKNLVSNLKEDLRRTASTKIDDLKEHQLKLNSQKVMLEYKKGEYIDITKEIKQKEELRSVLEKSRKWFMRFYELFDEEKNRKIIKDETLLFTNKVYHEYYGWNDRIVEFEEDNKIIVKDLKGKIIDKPSGAEGHVIGLAWRWVTADYFKLPLVLDEIAGLLDPEVFEKTKNLIVNWQGVDRQTIIFTFNEGLEDLPEKVYKVERNDNDISTITDISNTE